ncbi:Transcriptional regulator, LacI family [hydrothermal vent metagenome]|uniref:Transcriptional regulator, LacI family n=1 Tax=hydrothermal vent metagenome TaxID=652676 RepID=A0A3B0US05_9ZZZZ
MNKRPTIIDVAKKAGVSKSTVSLVLQNSPLVKKQTRAQVLLAIEETNYVYNRAAANLRGAGAGLIGLVINDLRNPYYTELAATTQMAFSKRGYATVIANSNEDPKIQAQVVISMLEHGISALMIAPSYGGDIGLFDDIVRAAIPTLQVLRKVDQRTELFPFFSMDYERGSFLAAQHLVERGAKNIAFVGGIKKLEITQERQSGYLRKMKEIGRTHTVFHGAVDREFGYTKALDIARNYPDLDAAITFNDLIALGMLAGFAEAGIVVGRDFRLVGFDDIKEAAQSFPKLSSVRCDVNKFGSDTAEILLNWLENNVRPQPMVRFPVKMVPRGSS